MTERKERNLRQLAELVEEHKQKMEKSEISHKKEMTELEKKIEELMKENTRSKRKLELQKEKQFKELDILKIKHKKELEIKEKELKKNEEEHMEEVRRKLRELEVAQEEIRTGRKTVEVVMKEEEVVYGLITELFEINRLWLLVMDEMDPIGKIDGKTKGAFDVLATILSDMEDRKWDMNKHCREKCVGAIQKNEQLIGSDTAEKVLNILDKIGKPFSCLQELIRQAKNQQLPNTKRLDCEVKEIAKLVRELEKIRIAPRRTVQMALDQENIRALAQ